MDMFARKGHRHAVLVVLLLVAACATNGNREVAPPSPPSSPTSSPTIAESRAQLREFGAKYHYDVGYMEQLLDASPKAYDAFAAAMGMSEFREQCPLDAHYVACISALMADDCGACTQLELRMAAEAGVDRAVLRQVLEDPASLPPVLRLVHDHATQVVRGGNADAARVAALRAALGDAAFGELAVNILGCRIYPGLRRAFGAERTCPAPNLDF